MSVCVYIMKLAVIESIIFILTIRLIMFLLMFLIMFVT